MKTLSLIFLSVLSSSLYADPSQWRADDVNSVPSGQDHFQTNSLEANGNQYPYWYEQASASRNLVEKCGVLDQQRPAFQIPGWNPHGSYPRKRGTVFCEPRGRITLRSGN